MSWGVISSTVAHARADDNQFFHQRPATLPHNAERVSPGRLGQARLHHHRPAVLRILLIRVLQHCNVSGRSGDLLSADDIRTQPGVRVLRRPERHGELRPAQSYICQYLIELPSTDDWLRGIWIRDRIRISSRSSADSSGDGDRRSGHEVMKGGWVRASAPDHPERGHTSTRHVGGTRKHLEPGCSSESWLDDPISDACNTASVVRIEERGVGLCRCHPSRQRGTQRLRMEAKSPTRSSVMGPLISCTSQVT